MDDQLISVIQREEQTLDGTTFHLQYTLWRNVTPDGPASYYIKCILERRCGRSLVGVDLEVADGLGSNHDLATAVFARVAGASSPAFPVHLRDLVRDLVRELGADVLPEAVLETAASLP